MNLVRGIALAALSATTQATDDGLRGAVNTAALPNTSNVVAVSDAYIEVDEQLKQGLNSAGLEDPTDRCSIGHVFSNGSVRSEAPADCSCFYDKLFMESELQYEWHVDYAPEFNRNSDPVSLPENGKLTMDIFKPPTIPSNLLGLRPAVVIVHGGNCRGGSKHDDPTPSLATDFARRGWIAAPIDYRLLSTADSCRTDGSIEAAGSDAKAAVRYLEANARRLMIDPDRIAIYGCSAGGRTSMYASFVDGNGVAERPGSKRRNAQDNSNFPAKISACVEMSADLWAPKEGTPVIKLDGRRPPLMILHGQKDGNKWTECSVAEKNYKEALDAGIHAEKYITPNGRHCDGLDVGKMMNFLYTALSLGSINCECNEDADVKFESHGPNKACRGDNSNDDLPSYYDEDNVGEENINGIDECKALCYGSNCHGIEYRYSTGRCELWKRPVRATKKVTGYDCFVKGVETCVDFVSRGKDKACRGSHSDDNSEDNYDAYHALGGFAECSAYCRNSNICYGIEYNEGTGYCEVWKRQPLATKDVGGYECFVCSGRVHETFT